MTTDRVIAARWQSGAPLAADLSPTAVSAENSAPLLSIKGLSVRFGGIVALDNVSFDVPDHVGARQCPDPVAIAAAAAGLSPTHCACQPFAGRNSC